MDKAARRKGLFLVTTGALFWGISGTVSKRLFQQTAIDVNWLVTTRLLIAGILLLTVHFLAKDRSQIIGVWKNRRSAIQLIVFGLVGMLSVQYTYMASIQHGNAAVATLLQYLAPVHNHHLFDPAETNDSNAKRFGIRAPCCSRLFFLVNQRLHIRNFRAAHCHRLGYFIWDSPGLLYLVRSSVIKAI